MAYYKKPYPKTPIDPNAPKKRGNSNWNPAWKKSTVIPGSQFKPIATPSSEQVAIINEIVDGSGSLIVEAYAGTGKTSTVCDAMHKVAKKFTNKTQAYLIFAKRNQQEAVGKCPESVEVKTAHAFGLAALGKRFGKIQVDKEKNERISVALVGADDDKAELRFHLNRAMDLGKDYLSESVDDVVHIIVKHKIEVCDKTETEFAELVLKAMDTSAQQTNIVSFSDMVWLPVKLNIPIPTFDILYLDEVQDLNAARQELAMRALGSRGRLIAIGDEYQSIFGFSGADAHSLKKLKERTNAKILPLHQTFRCGRAIVEMAKTFVADYLAAASNPEGEVQDVSTEHMMSAEGAQAGDFILSRTNAPLVKVAMGLLKQGRKVNIQGKDIGAQLLFMIKRSNAKTVPEFSSWLEDWKAAEIARLTAKKRDYEHIVDRAECLDVFCEGQVSIADVKANIQKMFDEAEPDETHRIICSSIHKSKGLERDRVWRLESSFTVKAKTEDEIQAEKNIQYVSITRAKDSLFLVG